MGDKATKEFFQACKERPAENRISELEDEQGTIKNSQEDLENICLNFYSKLYQARNQCNMHDSARLNILREVHPKLSLLMQQELCKPLTLEELTIAVKALAKGKAPGPDDILAEFYQCLWPCIGPEFLVMIQKALEKGQFPNGVTEGLIALLFKNGRRQSLNNWRPITLLNATYKIYAKALQLRLQPILMEIISPDQSAFLPMRYILDNLFLTHETIDFAKSSKQPLLFLKLDFSKAYDKVELRFLFQAIKRLGFPPFFIHMTELLFTGAMASVSVNGNRTSKFPISQGVRQGCPLAPYLFLIVGEVLNICG